MTRPPLQGPVERALAEAGLKPASAVLRQIAPKTSDLALADPDLPLYPASMIKTPLAAAACALAAQGGLRFDAPLIVDEGNMTANDAASPLVPGYRSTIRELIDLMLARSDNVATNMLFDAIGRDRATAIARDELGLAGTSFYRKLSGAEPLIADPQWDGVHRNSHPASDAAALFAAIASDAVPFAGLLRDILLRQAWNDKLPAGLVNGDRFAHKTGDTDEVTHDGGILFTSNATYAIVIYCGLPSSTENNARFGRFMAQVRSLLD